MKVTTQSTVFCKRLIFSLFVLLLTPLSVYAADTTAPTLTDFSISPATVDTTSADQVITVTFSATDDLSGIQDLDVNLSSDSGFGYITFDGFTLVSGTDTNGTYSAQRTLPRGSIAGTWSVDYFSLEDRVDNYLDLTKDDLETQFSPGVATFTNTATVEDTTAPTLTQVTAVPSPTTDTTPDYTFNSTEAGTITYGGDCASATTTATAGDNTITFNTLSVGAHTNCTITVTDAAINFSISLLVSSFTIDSDASQDIEDPAMIGTYSLSTNTINTTTGPETVSVTFQANDDLSGICAIGDVCNEKTMVAAISENDQYYNVDVERISGDKNNGFYRANIVFPQYAEFGSWELDICIVDQVGNRNCDEYEYVNAIINNATIDDHAHPQVVGTPDVSPLTINTDDGDVEIDVILELTDDRSGVCVGCSDQTFIYMEGHRGVLERISGDEISGVYHGIITIPQYRSFIGSQELEINVIDNAGNDTEYSFNYAFENTGINYDVSYPVVDVLSVMPNVTNASDASQTITVTVNATDNLSGVCVSAEENCVSKLILFSPGSVEIEADIIQLSGNEMSGSYQSIFTLPRFAQEGYYDLCYIISDHAHNTNDLCDSDVINDVLLVADATSIPTLTQVTAVPSPTTDTTPDYTFNSTEAGTITYGGDCSSATTDAIAGDNTITFNTLSVGAHTNCTITVTDAATNASSPLAVNAFTITEHADTTAPETTIDTYPAASTADTTAAFTFSSNEAGTFQCKIDAEAYAPCTSPQNYTGLAVGSHTFNVKAIDAASNEDATPAEFTWTITAPTDIAPPTLTQVTAVPSPTTDTTPDYTFNSTEAGTITYGGDCASATTTATAGDNTITFNVLAIGTHDNCAIAVTDASGNASVALHVNAFEIKPKTTADPEKTTEEPKEKEIPKPDLSFSGKLKDAVLSSSKKLYIEDDEVKFKGEYPEIAGGKVVIKYKRGSDSEEEIVDVDQNGNWSKKIGFDKDGTYKIKFTFFDKDGKEVGEKGYYKIKIDTEDPKIADMPGKLNKRPGDKIWWSATDNEEVDEYKYYFNGKKEKTDDPFFYVPKDTSKGTYILEIRVYDKAGNKDVKYVTIVVR